MLLRSAQPVERIYLPETLADMCDAVRRCAADGVSATISGARTGITGGAAPVESKAIISIEKFRALGELKRDDIDGRYYRSVGAGMTLADFQTQRHQYADGVKPRQLFYPIDPTETSAQIGGMIACNASGARTFRYGATRDWVRAVTVVFANGECATIRRGEIIASDSCFLLEASDGQQIGRASCRERV